LEDIPADLLVGKTRTGRSVRQSYSSPSRASSSETRWTLPSPSRAAPVIESRFNSGDRVNHPSWGEGMVLESKIQDNDEIVVIEFKSVGLKRLAASLANLEII
jgi:DNA helicase-2/ATP-dependent DNA helicase PcrA